MPDLKKTIEILFYGTDQVGKTITGIGSNLDSLSSSVTSATQPFADLTTKILATEAALAALALGGLALVVKNAGEFNDAFAEITTLLDAPATALEGFRTDILTYSRDSVKSIEDINESLYQSISAGTDYEDAISDLRDAEQFAVSTKADLSSATSLLAQTTNAYGREVLDSKDASDLFFTLIQKGVTRVDDLVSSMGNVTPIASQLGVPLETVNAALVALTKSGLNTSESVTTLTSLFGAFLKPTSAANQILGENAELFSASAIKSKGFETALLDVLKAVEFDETAIAKLTGRKEALIAALILGVDQSGFFKQGLEDMGNAAGATEEAYKKMADNFGLINQRLINNLQATVIEVGTPLLDEYAGIVDGITDIFKAVSIAFNEGAFDPIFAQIEAAGSSLEAYLKDIAQSLPTALAGVDWAGFTASVQSVVEGTKDLFRAFFGELDLTTPAGLRDLIQQIVDGFTSLNNITAGILEGLEPFIRKLGDMAKRLAESDEETEKLIGQFLGLATGIDKTFRLVGDLTGAIKLLGGSISLLAAGNILKSITNLNAMGSASTGLLLTVGKLKLAIGAFGLGYALGSYFLADIPIVQQMSDALANLVLKFKGLDEKTISTKEENARYTQSLAATKLAFIELSQQIDKLPTAKSVEIDFSLQAAFGAVDRANAKLDEIPETKTVKIAIKADSESIRKTQSIITGEFTDPESGETRDIVLATVVDNTSINQAKKDIETKIPPKKLLEIQLEGDYAVKLANIEAMAATVQTSLEWQAKLEIAEVEAGAERLVALATTTAESFQNTGDVLSSLVGDLGDLDTSQYLAVMKLIEDENSRRNDLLEAQLDLVRTEIDLNQKKARALESGEGLIRIDATGLEPELQLVFHKILGYTQVWANSQGKEFLYGLG